MRAQSDMRETVSSVSAQYRPPAVVKQRCDTVIYTVKL